MPLEGNLHWKIKNGVQNNSKKQDIIFVLRTKFSLKNQIDINYKL